MQRDVNTRQFKAMDKTRELRKRVRKLEAEEATLREATEVTAADIDKKQNLQNGLLERLRHCNTALHALPLEDLPKKRKKRRHPRPEDLRRVDSPLSPAQMDTSNVPQTESGKASPVTDANSWWWLLIMKILDDSLTHWLLAHEAVILDMQFFNVVFHILSNSCKVVLRWMP